MEGISHEACSLAGVLELAKLIALYDDNGISIDGAVPGWFADDTPARFRRLRLERDRSGRRPRRGGDAARRSRRPASRSTEPTLIVCRTTIGKGSPGREGTATRARRAAGRGRDPPHARGDRLAARAVRDARAPSRRAWNARELGAHARSRVAGALRRLPRGATPRWPREFERRMAGELPRDFEETPACRDHRVRPIAPRRWPRARHRRRCSRRWRRRCPSCWAAAPT